MSEDEDRPGPDGFPSLSTHTLQCGILFRKYIAARGTGLDKGFTKEQSDRFMDWTEDLGVFGPHLATLDYELRFRADVSYQIHGLLDDLYDRLLFGEMSPPGRRENILEVGLTISFDAQ